MIAKKPPKGAPPMAQDNKTNVMRLIEAKKLPYKARQYDPETTRGVDVAWLLGQEAPQMFKTLVTQGKSGGHYVFVIPVAEELDLKKAAKAVGEKSIAMIKSKELLPLTGYIHGGCSPIGMKKFFPTCVHESAKDQETIFFSAGKVGFQVEMAPEDLEKMIRLRYEDLIVTE